MDLFGFEIKRKQDENDNIPSFVTPQDDDGAVNIAATGTGISTGSKVSNYDATA